MDREIKFRAWDEADGLMYSDIQHGISFDDGSQYLFEHFINPPAGDYHKWHVMQCTGLSDKNGVEIFEGDIIDPHGGSKKEIIFLVDEYGSGFRMRNAEGSLFSLSQISDFVEVVGNIHINPELLEKP